MYFTKFFGVCVLGFTIISPVHNAPKHKYKEQSSTKLDQKQSGEVNIQVHLKDFHIFALLGDDPLGGLGDYDYNYDYSDLTIKPSSPSTTSEKPQDAASSSSSVEITTATPNLSSSPSSATEPEIRPSTIKVETEKSTESTSTTIEEKTTKSEASISLIPVKIIKDSQNDRPLPLGEILHYRKCLEGFSKDAQGRCRRIFRKNSQLPIHTINIMGTVLLIIVSLFVITQSLPAPAKFKYDQRQDGKWNVRADLENFLIFIIPTPNSGSSGSTVNTSLLDFFSKTIPIPYKRNRHQSKFGDSDEKVNKEQFIESKTAPYHVDISRSISHLAKLHPEVKIPEGVIIAQSPSVVLSKNQEEAVRSSRAIVIKVPYGNQNVLTYNKKELSDKGDGEKPNLTIDYTQLSPELKAEYAKVLADAIKDGLVQYFRKVAAVLRQENEDAEEDEPVKVENVEKKKLEKPKKKKGELESPKEDEGKKSKLLLLGATMEQCGPGLTRDANGICVTA
ncbi:hypothetical protein FQA39_LY00992 [Lamprigera yunnana]|nr:hypothetical protein FQA39_LY00992 [Lamprigera yunnana]